MAGCSDQAKQIDSDDSANCNDTGSRVHGSATAPARRLTRRSVKNGKRGQTPGNGYAGRVAGGSDKVDQIDSDENDHYSDTGSKVPGTATAPAGRLTRDSVTNGKRGQTPGNG